MKWETKNLLTKQNWKNLKGNDKATDKAKNVDIPKIEMRMG